MNIFFLPVRGIPVVTSPYSLETKAQVNGSLVPWLSILDPVDTNAQCLVRKDPEFTEPLYNPDLKG